jgi:hypothetical protein
MRVRPHGRKEAGRGNPARFFVIGTIRGRGDGRNEPGILPYSWMDH